jgi:ATP-dependent DNA helicase RecQ
MKIKISILNGRTSSLHPDTGSAEKCLHSVFGFNAFRENQRGIIESLLAGRDVFAVMPTGGGKSLCYQLPAMLLPGTALIVSPLIALMKDQVDAARAKGVQAAFVNSSQSPAEQARVLEQMKGGGLDLVYAAPERFALKSFRSTLKQAELNLIAIDEAHCISEWGHDFRPDYMALAELVKEFPRVPIAAFTATATEETQADTIERLGLKKPYTVRASFDRPNLIYEVQPKYALDRQLVQMLQGYSGGCGIVYRTRRKDVEQTASLLQENGISAQPYHAGMDNCDRSANQESFDRGDTQVIVATIAFGMGIDKPDIRFVVHGDLPSTIESYYQQTGRAGRDGRAALCRLFFDSADADVHRYFISQMQIDTRRQVATGKLSQILGYAAGRGCRRRRLLKYFGEELESGRCGACDFCRP